MGWKIPWGSAKVDKSRRYRDVGTRSWPRWGRIGRIHKDRLRVTIISHREAISRIIKFLAGGEGWYDWERGLTGQVEGRCDQGFAFRQPLAWDLRRAVTHRTHLFLCSPLFRCCASFTRVWLFLFHRCITRPVPLWALGRPSPFRALSTLRQTPFTVASRLVDPSFYVVPCCPSFSARKIDVPRRNYTSSMTYFRGHIFTDILQMKLL